MGHGFKHGASGAPLNFKVVGNPQPTNPKENMIWVNTDQEITEWVFAAENPYVHTSEDLYTEVGMTTGYYLDEFGNEVAGSNTKGLTDKIILPNGTSSVTIVTGDSSTTAPCHGFYDADGNLISTVLRQTGTTRYNVPSNAISIRVSVRKDDSPSLIATYADEKDGAVWISTGSSSLVEFNALKKNSLQVYPLSAQQHQSGAFVDVTAKSYQGGAWVDWITYLYNNGDEYTDVTGGWTASGFTYSGATITAGRNDEGVLKVSVTKSTSKDNVGLIGTAKKIALNGVSAIKIRYTINYIGGNGTSGTGYFGVCDVTDVANKNRAANVALNAAKDVESTAVLDVSTLEGAYYLVVSSWVGTESAAYTHYRVHEITFM